MNVQKLFGRSQPDLCALAAGAIRDPELALIDSIGEVKALDIAQRASGRQGIQVIYGGEDFEEYIDNYSESDDNHEMARVLGGRIPPEFIRAIIALGDYEQKELLAPTK